MAKRSNNFESSAAKKIKLDDGIDDLWGDDPENEDIDDCIILATKAAEESFSCSQSNNVSLLPTYNAFKQEQHLMFTSTQSCNINSSFNFPSSSSSNNMFNKPVANGAQNSFFKKPNGFKNSNVQELEMKIKQLQDQLEAKEGEATILRSQLKQSKASVDVENAKKQQEWVEKLKEVTKEMNAYKAELEFKNLEISNLKQKVLEVSRLKPQDSSYTTTPKKAKNNLRNTTESDALLLKQKMGNVSFEIITYPEKFYPLKDVLSLILPVYHEDKMNSVVCSSEKKEILFNSNLTEFRIEQLDHTEFLDKRKLLNVSIVYQDIAKLCILSTTEINKDIYKPQINKVFCTCHQLLHHFKSYLQDLENCTLTETIRQLDTLYLEKKMKIICNDASIFGSREWCENELGIRCRQMLGFVSELLPHSIYLQNYLFNKKPLVFNETEEYSKHLDCISLKEEGVCYDENNFIKLILDIVRIIGRIRKSYQCPGILSAITLFLSRICLTEFFEESNDIIYKIFKEIIFTRPTSRVLFYVSDFLKEASLHNVFINSICKMTSMNGLQTISKQGVVYFNQDSCALQVFCIIYEEMLLNQSTINVESSLNVIKFISNAFNSKAKWLYYQENNHCDCLSKITKLAIEIIYKTLMIYRKEHKDLHTKSKNLIFSTLFECGMEVISMLNLKIYDLMEKSIATYYQYKVCISSLMQLQNELLLSEPYVETLEQLNVGEELPRVEEDTFESLLC